MASMERDREVVSKENRKEKEKETKLKGRKEKKKRIKSGMVLQVTKCWSEREDVEASV